MEVAYICSPYRGNAERNTQRARRFCLHALRNGYVPFAPHLHFPQFLNEDDPAQCSLGLECGLTLMRKCDALFVYGDQVSAGMRREIDEAERQNVPVYYMPDEEGGSTL